MIIKEYFKDSELVCKCGCGTISPAKSVERLYTLRLIYGKPLVITSAARCVKHNNAVGGAPGSVHLLPQHRVGATQGMGGGAFDIKVSSRGEMSDIEYIARQCGFRGFGYGKDFLHIDDAARPNITGWIY